MAILQDTKFNIPRSYTVRQKLCFSDVVSTSSSTNQLSQSILREGFNNPYWKNYVAVGRDATGSYSRTERRYFLLSGTARNERTKCLSFGTIQYSELDGVYVNAPTAHLVGPIIGDTALNKAKSSLSNSASRKIHQVQGGVFVGELRQTFNMIRGRGDGIIGLTRRYLSAVKKSQKKRSRRRQKTHSLSGLYLEWQFGINPLLGDIKSLLEYQEKNTFDIERISAYGTEARSASNSPSTGSGVLTVRCNQLTVVEKSVRIVAGIRSGSQSPPLGTAASLGFTPDNFLPTAWELLPWSFLIDYFSNIGNIISAWSVVKNQMAWASVSTRRTEQTTMFATSIVPISGFTSSMSACSIKLRDRIFTRGYLGSIVPDLVFRVPGADSWQSLNIAMLALSKNKL